MCDLNWRLNPGPTIVKRAIGTDLRVKESTQSIILSWELGLSLLGPIQPRCFSYSVTRNEITTVKLVNSPAPILFKWHLESKD